MRFPLLLTSVFALSGAPIATATPVLDNRWCEYSTDRFSMMSDLRPERAQDLLANLDRFRRAVHHLVAPDTGRLATPLKVVAFEERRDFNRVFAARNYASFLRSSLYGQLLVLGPDKGGSWLDENALHEYVHYVMRHFQSAAYPLWYEEGYASYLATMSFDGDRVTLGRASKHRQTRYHTTGIRRDVVVRQVRSMSNIIRTRASVLNEMLNADSMARMPDNRVSDFYTDSWLLVHLLKHGHLEGHADRRHELVRYLDAIATGAHQTDAYEQAFESTPRQLGKELARYRKRIQHTVVVRQVGGLHDKPDIAQRCLEPAEVAFELGVASSDMNPDFASAAGDWLNKAKGTRAQALIVESLVHMSAGKHDDAKIAASRALEIDEGSAYAAVLLAKATFENCKQAQQCQDEWRQAAALYRSALTLDERRADAAFGLGVMHLLLGEVPEAIEYLEHAYALAPWAPRVSLFLGDAYRMSGDAKRARPFLMRAIRWELEESWRSTAERTLALIENES